MRYRSIFAGLLGLGLFLWACTSGPATVPENLLLRTRPEGSDRFPCGPLWEVGEQVPLRGLCRTSGGQPYLDVVVLTDTSFCWARFFLQGKEMGIGEVSWNEPRYVEVTGRILPDPGGVHGRWTLGVERWAVLPLNLAAVRESCRQAVAKQAAELVALDWAALALPAYVTGTAGFRPQEESLHHLEMVPVGVDVREPLLLLEARGPTLPPVRPLVERWVVLECFYDLEQERVVSLVATIQGEVQE